MRPSKSTALVAEVDNFARDVAERSDAALRELAAAHVDRSRVVAQHDSLVAAAVGQSWPGLVTYFKIVRAAEAVLLAGGERRPTLTRDPRTPRASAGAEMGPPSTDALPGGLANTDRKRGDLHGARDFVVVRPGNPRIPAFRIRPRLGQ